nr:MAG TPA: hypothetical protein [Caudoviricetes sp.]
MDKVSKVNRKGVIFRHYARKKDGTIIRPRFARCLVIPVDDKQEGSDIPSLRS